jgi:Fe2+ or Zn2+ uptake regulation protein
MKGPHTSAKRSTTGQKVIELRKQNLSIYDLSRVLQQEDRRLSPAAVARQLKDAGFAKTNLAVPWLQNKKLRLIFG